MKKIMILLFLFTGTVQAMGDSSLALGADTERECTIVCPSPESDQYLKHAQTVIQNHKKHLYHMAEPHIKTAFLHNPSPEQLRNFFETNISFLEELIIGAQAKIDDKPEFRTTENLNAHYYNLNELTAWRYAWSLASIAVHQFPPNKKPTSKEILSTSKKLHTILPEWHHKAYSELQKRLATNPVFCFIRLSMRRLANEQFDDLPFGYQELKKAEYRHAKALKALGLGETSTAHIEWLRKREQLERLTVAHLAQSIFELSDLSKLIAAYEHKKKEAKC